ARLRRAEARRGPVNNVRDEAWRRRLDAGLAENEGGARAPDVTAAVLARVAAGDAGADLRAMPTAPRARRWLAAAMALLGCGVVAGVWALERRGHAVHERPAQAPTSERAWSR